MRYFIVLFLIMLNLTCIKRGEYDQYTMLYLVNQGDTTLSTYRLHSDGNIDNISTQTIPGTLTSPAYMKLHPSKNFLYIQLSTSNYVIYYIGTDGIPQSPATFSNPACGNALADEGYEFFNPNGTLHTWCNGAATIYVDTVDQNTGALTQTYSLSPGASYLNSPIFHPGGKYLYMMWMIPIINGGADLGSAPYVDDHGIMGTNIGAHLHPNGKFVYCIVSNTILIYSIDKTAGQLNLTSTYNISGTIQSGATAVFHPEGEWLYITVPGSNYIQIFNVDYYTGAVSFNRNISTGTTPQIMAIGSTFSEKL